MIGRLRSCSVLTGEATTVDKRGPLPGQEAAIRDTILVVEDEVLVRMIVTDELRDAGYSVIEVADSQQALDTLAHSFNVKLILSDIQIPGDLDGLGLARVVRSAYPAIKIVLTSGQCGDVNGAEHDGFFQKPYDATELINHIGKLLD